MSARQLTAVLVASVFLGSASLAWAASSSGEGEAGRDQVRRLILDTCVYGQTAKEGMKKEIVVDRCQCAASRTLKTLKPEEIAPVAESKSLPDAWATAADDAFAACGKR
jgi:hypothetical protein